MLFRKKEKTYILDEQSLSNSRCTPLIEKGIFQGQFLLMRQPIYEVIPANVSRDELIEKRIKENIERIKKASSNKVKIYEEQLNKNDFLKLAQKHKATIIVSTNDTYNLLASSLNEHHKDVKIINLNELYEILKPDYLPGSEFKVIVSKKGKEEDEGIGYLEGGIKVVI
ncbi:MAG: hypothetical protein ABIK31_02985, partial [candidate division WOR-3 bacterium]